MKQRLHQTLLAGILSSSLILPAYAGNVEFNELPTHFSSASWFGAQVSDHGDISFSFSEPTSKVNTFIHKGYIWSRETGTRLIHTTEPRTSGIVDSFFDISSDGRVALFHDAVFKDDHLVIEVPTGHKATSLSPDGRYLGLIDQNNIPKVLNIDTGSLQDLNSSLLDEHTIQGFSKDLSIKVLSCGSYSSPITSCYNKKSYLVDQNNNIQEIETTYQNVWAISGDGSTVIGRTNYCTSGSSNCHVITNSKGSFEIDSAFGTNNQIAYGALNYDGSVAVGRQQVFSGNANTYRGLLWDKVNGERDIVDVLAQNDIDISNWSDVRLLNISQNGLHIVGQGKNPSGMIRGFIISSIPECTAGGLF